MKKIAIVSSIPFFVVSHLDNKIKYLLKKNYKITIITKKNNLLDKFADHKNLNYFNINFSRKISILNDIKCFIILFFHFAINRYDIIHSYTPKVGFLTSISSKLSFNKIRIHTFTGQHWKNKKKITKLFYKILDKIIINMNTICFADSFSQVDYLEKENVSKRNKVKVIHYGSVGGINFSKIKNLDYNNSSLLNELKIENNSYVVIFVGRINVDKGIFQLIEAVLQLKYSISNLILLMVGPNDLSNNNDKKKFKKLVSQNKETLHWYGYSNEIEKYLSISNLFCLPSTREGFGTSVIEAGSMKVPVLVNNIYGLNEIINYKNGFLLDNNTILEIKKNIEMIFKNKQKAEELSGNLYNDILNKYNSIDICKKLEEYYAELIKK